MMKQEKVFDLPYPTTSIIHGPEGVELFCTAGGLSIPLSFDDEEIIRSFVLQFDKVRAYRKRAEIYCTSWHVSDAYDRVCEIRKSDWVRELKEAAVKDMRDQWVMRHFIIYIDSFGCLEVVAESVCLKEGAE